MLSSNRIREQKIARIDMAGNINDIVNLYQRLRQNPMQVLSQRFNIPQNIDLSNPNDVIQHLLNTGQVSQSQVNQVMSMRNNPMVQQMLANIQH